MKNGALRIQLMVLVPAAVLPGYAVVSIRQEVSIIRDASSVKILALAEHISGHIWKPAMSQFMIRFEKQFNQA